MTVSQRLSDHFVGLQFRDLPPRLIEDVKTLVLDYLGVALAGSRTDSGRIAARFAAEAGGAGEATIVGDGMRVPALQAAFANAISSHSVELDDVDVLALFHFSPPVVSAALASAEREQAGGREFVVAVAAGCEMMARASAAVNPSLRDRGFHTTPVCGVFGAAIAASRLMKLDREATVSALGLAGAQCSGLMEMYGPSMQKRFNPGPSARGGVTAALMARLGFTGAATIFEGERGFCRAFSDRFDAAALIHNLGVDFPVQMEFKPYACARPIHNAVDCALNIRQELRAPLSSVAAITIRRHPAWAHYHQNPAPTTYHEAQMSLPYSVAVALVDGGALPPQYQSEKLHDPLISRLARLVEILPDGSLPRGVSCEMTLELEDGSTHRSQVDHPRGSIANPMTRDDMSGKVHMLADDVLGRSQVTALIDIVQDLESVPHIAVLTKALARPHGVERDARQGAARG
jgi:2-methylcitrate dehydratase PrpD